MADEKKNEETPAADTAHNHHHTHSWLGWLFGDTHHTQHNTTREPNPRMPWHRSVVTFNGSPDEMRRFAAMMVPQRSYLPLLLVLVWATLMAMWMGLVTVPPITINIDTSDPAPIHRSTPAPTPAPDPNIDLGAKLDQLGERIGGIESNVGSVKGQMDGVVKDVGDLKARPVPVPPKPFLGIGAKK